MIKEIERTGVNYVCITGGEPMQQPNVLYPLVYELVAKGYKVSIETSGCMPIEPDAYNRSYKYVMDVKCPSSGVSQKNVLSNLANLLPKDEVKFVIGDEADYKYARKIIRSNPTSASILMSPVFDKDLKPVIGKELIEWILRDRLYFVRVQIQVHKILGVL